MKVLFRGTYQECVELAKEERDKGTRAICAPVDYMDMHGPWEVLTEGE